MGLMQTMKQRRILSFEVFPPKTDDGMEKLVGQGGTLDHIYELKPDYISCTYGAGGTNVGKNLEVLKSIKASGKAEPVTHLTCIGSTREQLRETLQTYLDNGIDHVLALRGDLPFGWTGTGGDLGHATELVRFIREEFGDRFTIAVAGSPEGHIQCRNLEADMAYLRQKQDEGADFIMTQLCWDMHQFERWLDAIRKAGITMPVDVGIMPVLSIKSVINMSLSRNGCAIPRDLAESISRHWIFPNPFTPEEDDEAIARKEAEFRKEGLEYTISLLDRYCVLDIAGIHLYALNKHEAVAELLELAGIKGLGHGFSA